MNPNDTKEILKQSEFFKGFAEGDIQKLSGLGWVETLAAGEYLFRQGDFGNHIYIIVEGHIFLERSRTLGTREGKVLIGALGKGRVCGCWSTILDEPHILMSSALCQKPTTVLAINGADLRQVMLESTQLGFNILERLCFLLRDRIQSAYGAMENI